MEKQEIKNKIELLEKEFSQITMQINSKEYIENMNENETIKLISLLAEIKTKIEYLKKMI